MKADSFKIAKVFSGGGDVLYLLPHFQREYTWEEENWKTLFADVLSIYDAYSPTNEPEHFMGSLVVINDGTRNGVIPAFKLVDGQQRLTTISLLLCALQRNIKNTHPEIARKIRKLVTNPDKTGDIHYKILPTTKYGDRTAYLAILNGEDPLPSTQSKIPPAFEYFRNQLSQRIAANELDPERFFIALTNCLQVVFIDLNMNERPYEIFESLNAKGKPLSPADLVRNYIAMKLPEAKQQEVFDRYWSKIDDTLQEKRTVGKSRLGELTAFLRHYLAMLSGTLCNERHVYERFRDRMEKECPPPDAFVAEIVRLKHFAQIYDRFLRPDHEPNEAIRRQLIRLNILETSTAYPFLLAMYDAMLQSQVTEGDLLEGLQTLENYLVRRYLAGEPTNYLNKMFPTLWREVNTQGFGASLKQALLSKNYPSDVRLKQTAYTEELYDRSSQVRLKTCLVLETINQHLSAGMGGFSVLDGEPTIEHIMPQSLSREWETALGQTWSQVHQDNLNMLGNLTLVTRDWNSELSNASFAQKKRELARHALKLNADYFSRNISKWNEDAIHARADYLIGQATEIWSAFGEPPAPAVVTGRRPRAIVILGERIPVQTWRDVALKTAEIVSQLSDDFDQIAQQMPNYFNREQFQRACSQLSNGWWVYLNLSSGNVKSFCRRFITIAGIPDEEWLVEEESANG